MLGFIRARKTREIGEEVKDLVSRWLELTNEYGHTKRDGYANSINNILEQTDECPELRSGIDPKDMAEALSCTLGDPWNYSEGSKMLEFIGDDKNLSASIEPQEAANLFKKLILGKDDRNAFRVIKATRNNQRLSAFIPQAVVDVIIKASKDDSADIVSSILEFTRGEEHARTKLEQNIIQEELDPSYDHIFSLNVTLVKGGLPVLSLFEDNTREITGVSGFAYGGREWEREHNPVDVETELPMLGNFFRRAAVDEEFPEWARTQAKATIGNLEL